MSAENTANLVSLEIELAGTDAPPEFKEMLEDAEARLARFMRHESGVRIPAFVASNFHIACMALRDINRLGLAAGRSFCEWGSGLGIVTCLASRLGFDAVGIEIEPRLVDGSRQFAAEFAPQAKFVEGSYQPEGLFSGSVNPSQLASSLGFSPPAFDLIYVYPWPAEERAALSLFQRFGRDQALLLSYHGGSTIRLHRRVEL